MDTFRIVVLAIAVVVLIGFLAYVGSMIKADVKSQMFPPISQQCPDGWTYSETRGILTDPTSPIVSTSCTSGGVANRGTAGTMKNLNYPNKDLIKLSDPTKNIGAVGWGVTMKPATTVCLQREWANKNGISWDGVSNFNGCE